MIYRILVLGASYGSLFATKCLMADHDVTLVCRAPTAELINAKGTEVRLPPKGDAAPLAIRSADLPGTLDATTPEFADPSAYDLAVLAMQEPQYAHPAMRGVLTRIAETGIPCLSLMNMPPLPYLRRIPAIDAMTAEAACNNARVWDRFDPEKMTLCSPDPQAVRPAGEPANVLRVGLATNFKTASYAAAEDTEILTRLADDIDAVRIDGRDVPVKLRVHDSPFVPFAKWPMLLTGNYRCITPGAPVSIREAVHGNVALSRQIYDCVASIVRRLGASADDLVPFDKYAAAAEKLTNPSSVARAMAAGASAVERVDRLVQIVGRQFGITHAAIDRTVALVDATIEVNRLRVA
ncbi:MAG: hypothetical protein OJF62_000465 [Pseudolabrys sp.]|jgi:hypothetical protein|nr:hypothetical protein [Pseudolabrys sp.]